MIKTKSDDVCKFVRRSMESMCSRFACRIPSQKEHSPKKLHKFHVTTRTSSDADSCSDRDFSAVYKTTAHKYLPLTHILSQATYSPVPYRISTMTDPSFLSYIPRQPNVCKHPVFCLQGTKNATNSAVINAGLWAEI